MKNLDVSFPLDKLEKLIFNIGWESLDAWLSFWHKNRSILSINEFWGDHVNDDWIWGLALPFISQAYYLKENFSERKIIGLSALPGTGKTTLGKWIEKISLKLNFKISVISIDDFYLPSKEMKIALKNNPWDASRGFPGSHSVKLMYEKLHSWKLTGRLEVPVFDKSLRNGLGDRSHWRYDNPDLLILEGWFLGINPFNNTFDDKNLFVPPLTLSEFTYREKISKNLYDYLDIWTLIDNVWHLKPIRFEYMQKWKLSQEKQMLLKKGSALEDLELSNFLRMLNVSIPHKIFEDIKSDVLLLINQERKIIDITSN